MSNQFSAREIIGDIYLAVDDAELFSFEEPYVNAVRRVVGDTEFIAVIGEDGPDDNGDMIFMWTGYERDVSADGPFNMATDTSAGLTAGNMRQTAQEWLQAQG
jgi:hypothetical protein